MREDYNDSGRSSPQASISVALVQEMGKPEAQGFDDVMKYVVAATSMLQQNYKEEELVNGLGMLESHLKKQDAEVICYMEKSQIHQHVLTVLRHNPQSLEIQQAGFSMLLQLCEVSSKLKNNVVREEIHRFILDQLSFYKEDPLLQRLGVGLLAHLLSSDNNIEVLVQKEVHLTLMELCAKYPSNRSLMSEATDLLALLTNDERVKAVISANNFTENGLFVVMEMQKLSDRVQRAGLRMLEVLLPNILKDPSKADDISQKAVKCIYTAMFTQVEHATVQAENTEEGFNLPSVVAGCRVLCTLLEHRSEAIKFIGEATEEKQEPVHDLCVDVLFAYRKDPDIFVAVCEAVFWLAADNERLCTALMNKNVHVSIIDGLRRHKQHHLAVESGCRALRGLSIFLPKHKEDVVKADALDLLLDFQLRYKNDIAVQTEVVSAIACLADVDVVRHQCFVSKVPEKIIETMYQFSEEIIIQEASLEAFGVLAGAEGGPDLLLNTRTLYIVLETMETSPDNFLIIKKGLIVLQLLASPVLLRDGDIRNRVVALLKSALVNFPRDKSVQAEACVAVQLLAEADATMSRAFVDANCHECLFRVLENNALKGIQELASECLYVLSQEQNQKSIMLLSACRQGMLPATECLIELGADVNVGDEKQTPLFLAVANNHEEIVRILLRQEISNMHAPLEKSIEQGSHVITGLLLQQLGLDRDGLLSPRR